MHGLPVGFALTGAKADERQTLLPILDTDPTLTGAERAGQILIADKNYYGREFEATLAEAGVDLLRPARKGEQPRAGTEFFKPLRQTIESINDTFKGQLDLEQHGGHTPAGVWVRVVQRVLALTAAIWHNDRTGQPIERSLLTYDHSDSLGIVQLGSAWVAAGLVPAAERDDVERLLQAGDDGTHPVVERVRVGLDVHGGLDCRHALVLD